MDSLFVHFLIALAAALAGGALASLLRQPAILGFLVIGLVLSPFTPGLVAPTGSIAALAEVGVIFLMFAVGVQLSLPELLRQGRVAVLGALIQVALTLGLGVAVGLAMGWSLVEALVFGAVLSNSSSTVLSRVLLERGELESRHGKLGIAWSSVQDISTIVLVAVFSALAPTAGRGPWLELARAAVFLLLVMPVALWALPRLFERIARSRSRELFTLTVATVALGMAWGASLLGVSLALGAFAAGVIVGESPRAHRILGEAIPLRDIFSGVFFVSIGMSIDPLFVAGHWHLIAITAALTVIAKGVITTGVALLLGCSSRLAVLLGAGLAQSAEFSFILAQIARELGLIGPELFGTMLAGAALSILFAPAAPAVALALFTRLRRGRPSAAEDEPPRDEVRTGHTIVCGHGRVGGIVVRLLERLQTSVVVIEEDPENVRTLVQRGTPAIEGDAAQLTVLERADVAHARVLVTCLPERMVVRRIVDHALAKNPDLVILTRTHWQPEIRRLHALGVTAVVMGEVALAIELGRRSALAQGLDLERVTDELDALRRQFTGPPAPRPAEQERYRT